MLKRLHFFTVPNQISKICRSETNEVITKTTSSNSFTKQPWNCTYNPLCPLPP